MALEELVRGRLDVHSNPRSGGIPRWTEPELTKVELSRFIGETVESMRPMAEAKQIRLEYDASAKMFAQIYPSQMVMALQNVIENGIDATDSGCVSVILRQDGRKAVIEIADTGSGIPEFVLSVLFIPFATYGKPGRLGVGLWAARVALERLGGTIRGCNSASGAQFTLHIPLDGPEGPGTVRIQ